MAFFKTILKGHKHKKLSDEWDLAPKGDEPPMIEMENRPGSSLEGITFQVKYLGSTLVTAPSDPKVTAEAVKNIVAIAKSTGRKGKPVQFAINLRGVSIMEQGTKTHTMDISLYRISYCSADATFGHVFAFIATNDNETMECHAFLCNKRKMAQLISITVAQTFNTAYHLWSMTQGDSSLMGFLPQPTLRGALSPGDGLMKHKDFEENTKSNVLSNVLAPLPMLIDLTTPIDNKLPSKHDQWAIFED